MRIHTKSAFWLAFAGVLLAPILFPRIHLFYFAPYLVICMYRYARFSVIWRACVCGVIIDLFSSGPVFGLTACNYCFISFFLYMQTRNFFEDKLSTLPLMTFLFSLFSTIFTSVSALFLDRAHPLSLTWVATDLIGMPVADAFYALLVFSLPFQLIYEIKKLRLLKES